MGMLAIAGGLGGLGQGITEDARDQNKMNMEAKMNDLAQQRETAITRLQGQQQSDLSKQNAGQSQQLEEMQSGHADARVDKEIGGRAAVSANEISHQESAAAKDRDLKVSEGAATRASHEKIGAGHDAARIASSKAAHPATGKQPPGEFKQQKISLQPMPGPNNTFIPGKQILVQQHRDGSSWVPAKLGSGEDVLIPYSGSSENGLSRDPTQIPPAPDNETQKLLSAPLAILPSGVSARDSFAARNHYLPAAYMGAAQTARDAMQPGRAGGATPVAPASDDNEQPDPMETAGDPE